MLQNHRSQKMNKYFSHPTGKHSVQALPSTGEETHHTADIRKEQTGEFGGNLESTCPHQGKQRLPTTADSCRKEPSGAAFSDPFTRCKKSRFLYEYLDL